ncbi:MAG: hypothetical protein ORN25_06660, partial [Caulobacteraceae bacterium]|nr:hypothetical protein [Caulobacteraceae bacterium]
MPGLTESQGKIVRSIVQTVPDAGLGQLTSVLSAQMGEHTMADVRDIVMVEMRDRKVRSIVFSPIVSLCEKNQPGKNSSRFPFELPTLLWNALVDTAPKLMAQAREMALRSASEEVLPYIFNQACDAALTGLQTNDPNFQPVVVCLAKTSPDSLRDLIGFLKMSSVLRDVLIEIPLWVGRMNSDDELSVRLAYRDAAKLTANGPARLFEYIYINLEAPRTILRIISAALDRPSDLSVEGTDLIAFGDLLLDQCEASLQSINGFDLGQGASAGTALASAAKSIIGTVTEFEECIALSKNGPWGRRVARIKRDVSVEFEKLIFQVEILIPKALPVAAAGQNQKALNRSPNMFVAPDPSAAARLEAILTFMAQIRSIASASGVGVLRSRIIAETQEFLEFYSNGVFALLSDFNQDPDAVRARIDVIAKYVALVHDDEAAERLRRRVITM